MKILIVSTLKRSVNEKNFASRSRIIFQLSKELAARGHSVSLLGTGDSLIPGVTTIPVIEKGWVDLPAVENEFLRDTATLMQQSRMITQLQNDFDIIHNHTYPDFFPMIVENELHTPLVTTFHAVYDYYVDELSEQFPKTHGVALSKKYQSLFKKGKLEYVVYNGVDTSFYTYKKEKKDFLFWLGRLPQGKQKDGTFMDPKGVRWAIDLARQTGEKLIMSAPVEDPEFFEKDVRPFLNDKIQWLGDVSAKQTVPVSKIIELYQDAKAFLMTVNQHENFGLVMAESMSCGTPVIGFDRGAVPEVIADGKTGFVVPYEEGTEGLKKALAKISTIKPEDCRKHVEDLFSIERMVSGYEHVYESIISSQT
ncbi:hypothetical protein BH09PAT2_BH09PAT2_07580 [soil metagenome]